MSLSNPRVIYGVHSVTPYNRDTGEFYGTAKVVGDASISMQGDLVELNGGSSKFPWAIEDSLIKSELSMKIREYPDFLFQIFLGKAPTENTADTAGTPSTAVNKKGTSVIAATGLASVTVKTAAKTDLKFGKYVIKAVDTTHVDVYFSSDADIGRGTVASFQNDLLKVTATPLLISTGATVDLPSFGLTLTGGATATAFVAGDTATFEVLPPSSKSMQVTVGSITATYPEFGCIIMAQKRGNQEMFEIDAFRCKGIGFPIGFKENSFSEADLKVKAFYDSVQDGVFRLRHISPS